MVSTYIPNRGDIVFVQFSPQTGREQAGLRPALILSPSFYTERSGLALACPITHKQKGYPFEVLLPKQLSTRGVILVDHLKSIDWNARGERFIETVSNETLEEAIGKLKSILGDTS
jgi:mRNA interferase MazF